MTISNKFYPRLPILPALCAALIFPLFLTVPIKGDYKSYLAFFDAIGKCETLSCVTTAQASWFEFLVRDPLFAYLVSTMPLGANGNIYLIGFTTYLLAFCAIAQWVRREQIWQHSSVLFFCIPITILLFTPTMALNLLRQGIAVALLLNFFASQKPSKWLYFASAALFHYASVGLVALAMLPTFVVIGASIILAAVGFGHYEDYASQTEQINVTELMLFIILAWINTRTSIDDLQTRIAKNLSLICLIFLTLNLTFPFERTLIVLELISIRNIFSQILVFLSKNKKHRELWLFFIGSTLTALATYRNFAQLS